ncbi:FACT complex subunit SSRP1 [Aphelenchoides bicaudatus]|nr:FACT complex subunit SSRP1 [Aphelenchoides bicaudatus]
MYVHKPPMYIRFDEIDNIHFARSDATTRSFDVEIVQRNGPTINFSNIAKEDYNKLFDFVERKGLKVRNTKRMEQKYKEDAFAGSDEELDPYKEKLKDDAASDDESDTDDEDFDVSKAEKKQQQEKNSSEGSGSEPEEEYSSAASDVTDDLIQPAKKAKKDKGDKSKKEKKETKKAPVKKPKVEKESPTKKNISKEFVDDDSDSSDSGSDRQKPSTSSGKSKSKSKRKSSSEEESMDDSD